MPIHDDAFFGSPSSSHTVSGFAAITSSRSTAVSVAFATLLLLLSFGLSLQRLELLVPEAVEKRSQLGEPLWARSIEALCAVPPLVHETRLLQHAQVLGDCWARDLEMRCDLTGRQLPAPDQFEDPAPPRLGDRAQ